MNVVLGNWFVYFFSFLLAFCSLYYEYVSAQVMSVYIGGTKGQYLIIISLFTCALGIGALLFNRLNKKFSVKRIFITIEILLTLLGGASPYLISYLLGGNSPATLLDIILSYGLIFLIGLLSGFEIPCLFELAPNRQGKILAFDYLGMLAVSWVFPFLLLPHLGSGAGVLFVASLNLLALIWLLPKRNIWMKPIFGVLCFSLIILIVKNADSLNHVLTALYLGDNL